MKTPEEVCSLEREIETARELLEITKGSGQVTAAAQLLKVIATLSKEIQLSKFRAGEVLSRESVLKVGGQMGVALAAVLRERGIEDWKTIVDEVGLRIVGVVEAIDHQELPRIGHSK